MGNAFCFYKQRSCKWCFHLKTTGFNLVGCDKQGWQRIVFDISALFKRGGAAKTQAIEFKEKAMWCKHFCRERKDTFYNESGNR